MSRKLQRILEELQAELAKQNQPRNVKFMTLIKRYRPTASESERFIIRAHFLEHSHKTMAQLDIKGLVESHLDRPKSSVQKLVRCLERIIRLHDSSFEVKELFRKSPSEKNPKIPFRNLGKEWTDTQILYKWQVLEQIDQHVSEKYKLVCYLSAFSTLRLGNCVRIRFGEINRKEGWLKIKAQTKTGHPVKIPISKELEHYVFKKIKFWSMDPDDFLFPEIQGKENALSTQNRRAWDRYGIEWATFHHYRHFGACHLINNGVEMATVRAIMGHKDFRSTLRYARVRPEKLQEAARAFDVGT